MGTQRFAGVDARLNVLLNFFACDVAKEREFGVDDSLGLGRSSAHGEARAKGRHAARLPGKPSPAS
jgi:hypothetical protein